MRELRKNLSKREVEVREFTQLFEINKRKIVFLQEHSNIIWYLNWNENERDDIKELWKTIETSKEKRMKMFAYKTFDYSWNSRTFRFR